MKLTFLDKLACPFDKNDLTLKIFKQEQEEIVEGVLTCADCHRYYPIVQGIPIMSPDEYREVRLEIPLLEKWGERLVIENDKPLFQLAEHNQE